MTVTLLPRPHEARLPALPALPAQPALPDLSADPDTPPAGPVAAGHSCCGHPHPDELSGGGEPELVAALRAGCPLAARMLIGAVEERLLVERPALAATDLAGRCWLLLAQWPATGRDLVAGVARRLLHELNQETAAAQALVALSGQEPPEPEPDPVGAAAVVERALLLELVSTSQAVTLTRRHLQGLTSEQVAALEGRSPGAVRAGCHRTLRRLRARRDELLEGCDAPAPGCPEPRRWPVAA